MPRCNYIIRVLTTMAPVQGHCYEHKDEAKAVRKTLNGTSDEGREQLKYIVSPGPDHPRHGHRQAQ